MQVLPASHRICWPDATVQDLAYALRYSTVMCSVADSFHFSTDPDLRIRIYGSVSWTNGSGSLTKIENIQTFFVIFFLLIQK